MPRRTLAQFGGTSPEKELHYPGAGGGASGLGRRRMSPEAISTGEASQTTTKTATAHDGSGSSPIAQNTRASNAKPVGMSTMPTATSHQVGLVG